MQLITGWNSAKCKFLTKILEVEEKLSKSIEDQTFEEGHFENKK